MEQREIEIQKSQQQFRQSKSLAKPKFAFEANYTLAAGGRQLDFPIGDLLNPVYGTLNQLTQSNDFPPVENTAIQFLPNNFQETKITFAYPIYNSDLKYNRRIQGQLLESKTAFKLAEEQELRYDITNAYIQYLQTFEAERLWQNTRTVLLELRRFNESLVRNNVATQDVVATADYELSKADNEVFHYRTQQNSGKAYFNYLLGRDLQTEILIDTNLIRQEVPAYDLESVLQLALEQRAEIKALESLLTASQTNINRNEAKQKLPEFYLGGALGFQGFGYKFDRDQAYGLAQVGLTYDLFDGHLQKSKTQESRLEKQLAGNQLLQVKQQLKLQVTVAFNELESARFAFQSAENSVVAARSIFKITNNKYRAGQALLLEFLDAQNRMAAAQLQQLLSWADVLMKEAALKKVAGI